MQSVTKKMLNAAKRKETGKGAARRLRRMGKLPAILYGSHGATPISIDQKEFLQTFHDISESTIITLVVEKTNHDVLMKDYAEDVRTGKVFHIDFFEIDKTKKLHTHVPVEITGSSVGVRAGGILEHMLYDVEIECLPKDIPEHISIDITDMEQGDVVHIRDIAPLKGVKFLNLPDQPVVSITTPKIEETETPETEDETVETASEEAESEEESQ